MKLSKRTQNRVLKEDWLSFLYEEVLLYCENDSVDFSGYNLNKNPFLAELQKKHQFSLIKDKLILFILRIQKVKLRVSSLIFETHWLTIVFL